jgi:NAD dependent epimerase/dehydratase family enzyme
LVSFSAVKGGAIKQMLTPFKLGLGGKVGSGSSFIVGFAIDIVAAISMLCKGKTLGPVNVVSPNQ